MANAANIFSGPAQVSLYDATNKELFLGYHEQVKVTENNLAHNLIDNNNLQYGALTKVEIPLFQSDPTLLAAIKARRTTKQSIYIVGMDHLLQIDNVYVSVVRNRIYLGGEIHTLLLKAQTEVEADVGELINMLGEEGACDTDTNTDGVADGWTDATGNTVQVIGGQQQFKFDGASQTFYYDFICPLDQPVKITVSSTVENREAVIRSFEFGFKTKNNAGTVVDTKTHQVIIGESDTVRESYTVSFTPGAAVAKISVYFEDYNSTVAQLSIEDVQLQFGPLTDYTENI